MASDRPSVLAVTSQLPWPLNTGGHLRTFHLMRSVAARFRLRLIAGIREANPEGIEALERAGVTVCPVRLPPRQGWREGLTAAGAALRGEPYVLYHRHNHNAVRAALHAEMQREPPDLVYLDHLDSAVFFRHHPEFPLVLDLHNVYSLLIRREALERRGLARFYLQREARLLSRAEERAVRLADVVFSVSEIEANHFRNLGGRVVQVVPNGVDCSAYEALPTARRNGPPVMMYVGTMSWAPNASAARYLASEVLPRVRQRIPAAELWIVGKEPPPDLVELGGQAGVSVLGGVPSMQPYLGAAHVLPVPLEAGGGTRLKILEAFAAGLPVISTAVGCEGLSISDGEHLMVRERDKCADALVELLSDPAKGEAMARRARDLVRRLYDWEAIGKQACECIESVICSRPR